MNELNITHVCELIHPHTQHTMTDVTCATQDHVGSEPWHLANSMVGLSSVALILEFIVVVLFSTGWFDENTRWRTLGVYVLTVAVSTGMFGWYAAQYDLVGHIDCHMTRAALGLSIVMWIFFVIGACCGIPLGFFAKVDYEASDKTVVKDVEATPAPHPTPERQRLLPGQSVSSNTGRVGSRNGQYRYRYPHQ